MSKREYDRVSIGNGLYARTRRRPEHVSQPLGKNAPTFRVKLSDLTRKPTRCDYNFGSFGGYCGRPVVEGLDRCSEHPRLRDEGSAREDGFFGPLNR